MSGSAPLSRARLGWATCCSQVDSVAKVGFSSKIVQGVRLALDGQPSLLQTVVAFASVLSRNRSDAEVLKGVMALIGEAQSVDEEVLAEITGLHLRRRDDQAVSKAAARVPGELTSKMRAALAAAAAQSGFLSVLLGHLRLLPSLDKGHSCPLSSSTVVKILGLAVEDGNSFPCCDRTRPPAGNP